MGRGRPAPSPSSDPGSSRLERGCLKGTSERRKVTLEHRGFPRLPVGRKGFRLDKQLPGRPVASRALQGC